MSFLFLCEAVQSCPLFLKQRLLDPVGRDGDGYYWLTGRVDDVINVSGHRIGTAEVESALVSHPQCAEAAVVGFDHEIKGQGIYAFITLLEGVEYSQQLRATLINAVRIQVCDCFTYSLV
jgi:acetyl-CoA synthetase